MKTEILLIDKNADFSENIASLLSNNFTKDVQVYNSLEEMPEKSPDVKRIVIYIMTVPPDTNYHHQHIEEKRKSLAFDYIIVLTKENTIKSALNFIKAGAIDCIELDEKFYAKLDDTLTNVFKFMSLKENINTIDSKLDIRSRQLIGSISLTILLITLAFLMF
ncbi:MAG: hypothetical protein ACKVPJ_04795 [Chitinophagales bacterium]